jgi:hypothetical protein
MKRENVLATGAALGVISLLAGAWLYCPNQPPGYSLASSSICGYSFRSVCSFKLPVVLSHFSITQKSWDEDTNGRAMSVWDTREERRACSCYEIQWGSHSFNTPTNRGELGLVPKPVFVTTKLVP